MLQVIRCCFIIWSITITLSGSAEAAGFCAVTVEVRLPNGRLVEALPVKLYDSSRNVVAQATTVNGIAQFCDFGFGEHSVVVGDKCGTEIRKVEVVFPQPQHLRTILNSCEIPLRTLRSCYIYARVRDRLGSAVANAEFMNAGRPDGSTDQYGRIGFLVPGGERIIGQFSKTGFQVLRRTFECQSPKYIEMEIILEGK